MNLREILKKWLKDNGYDGLCRPYEVFDECWCKGNDILGCPVDKDPGLCIPGYLSKDTPDGHNYLIKEDKDN